MTPTCFVFDISENDLPEGAMERPSSLCDSHEKGHELVHEGLRGARYRQCGSFHAAREDGANYDNRHAEEARDKNCIGSGVTIEQFRELLANSRQEIRDSIVGSIRKPNDAG